MTEASIMEVMQKKLGTGLDDFLIPPPVFETMQGEFLDYDLAAGWLRVRFPVLEKFLNPYGSMQGGMVAAAVDNALGPLSMMVAPPNVTRRLEMKYSRPATLELGHITVKCEFLGRQGRQLAFRAQVRDPEGKLLARARAWHWILDDIDEL